MHESAEGAPERGGGRSSRSRAVLRNTVAALTLQVVIAGFGFVTPGLVIRTYGSEVNGLVASISQVLRYFALMEAGLGGAALFALYGPLGRRDFQAVNKVLAFTTVYFRRVGLLFLGAVLFFAPLYALGLGSTLSKGFVMVMFLVIGLSGALEFVLIAPRRILLTADEKGYVLSIVGLVGVVLQQGVAIGIILAQGPVQMVYAIAIPILVARAVTLAVVVRRVFRGQARFRGRPSRADSGIRFQRDVFLHEIAFTLNQASPLVAVSVLHGLDDASIFAVYALPITMVSLLMATFHQAAAPSFGRLIAEVGAARGNSPFQSFQFWYYAVSAWLLCSTAVLATPFVSVYTTGVHDVDYVQPAYGYLLTLFAAATSLRVVYAILTSSHGLFQQTAKWAVLTSGIGLLITYGLGVISAPLTIVGPVVALVLNSTAQARVLRKLVPVVPSSQGLKTWCVMVTLVGVFAAGWHTIGLHPEGWVSFLILCMAVAGCALVVAIAGLAVYERTDLRAHLGYVWAMFRKRPI